MIRPPVLVSLMTLLVLTCSHAAKVASDNFDSQEAETSPQLVKSSLEWNAKNQNFVFQLIEDTYGLNSGNSLLISMPYHYGGLYVSFPEVSLEQGQTLTASLRFRFSAPPPPATNGLRFGFIEGTAENPADGSSPGYWVMTNPGLSEQDACIFFEAGTDTGLGGGEDLEMLGKVAMSAAVDTEPHTLVISVTRAADGNEISWQLDEGDVQTRMDPNHKALVFNTFALCIGDLSNIELLIDDLDISKE